MKYIIFYFLISIICVNEIKAEVIDTTTNGKEDIISSFELKLADLEETIKTLTKETEKSSYKQKRIKEDTSTKIKEINESIEEIKKSQYENDKKMAQYEIEMQNLKNITELLKKDMTESLKVDMATLQSNMIKLNDTMSTIATTEPLSLLDETNIIKDRENPSENLLISNDENMNNIVIEKEVEEYKQALMSYENQDYKNSALKFAEIIKNKKDDEIFYDSLYYLGLSLKNLEKQEETCGTFKFLLETKASEELKNKAKEEITILNCK